MFIMVGDMDKTSLYTVFFGLVNNYGLPLMVGMSVSGIHWIDFHCKQ